MPFSNVPPRMAWTERSGERLAAWTERVGLWPAVVGLSALAPALFVPLFLAAVALLPAGFRDPEVFALVLAPFAFPAAAALGVVHLRRPVPLAPRLALALAPLAASLVSLVALCALLPRCGHGDMPPILLAWGAAFTLFGLPLLFPGQRTWLVRMALGGLLLLASIPLLLLVVFTGPSRDGAAAYLCAIAFLLLAYAGLAHLVDGVLHQTRRWAPEEARVRDVERLLDDHYATGGLDAAERDTWRERLARLAAQDARRAEARRRASLLLGHGWTLVGAGGLLFAVGLVGGLALGATLPGCADADACPPAARKEGEAVLVVLSLPGGYAVGAGASMLLTGLLATALSRRARVEADRDGAAFDEGMRSLKEEVLLAVRHRAKGPAGRGS